MTRKLMVNQIKRVMKELSIEEKSKRYDEALEIAKEINNEQRAQPFNVMTRVFPELKEECEDERIKNEIIAFVEQSIHRGGGTPIPEEQEAKWLAWLEKQGEQKPAKTPQWMIDFLDEHRRHFGNPMEHDERRDVDGKLLCIKKWLEGNYVEQKPAWSEQDEKIYNLLYEEYKDIAYYSRSREKAEDIPGEVLGWLKSLKYRVQLQPKQEWSKEDREYMESLLDIINGTSSLTPSEVECHKDWLKSLRPQLQWKPSGEQMEALKEACDEHWEPDGLDPLYTLYQELKELRGE